MQAANRDNYLPHPSDRSPDALRRWLGQVLAPAGQLVLPGAPAQLGLDGRPYEPRARWPETSEYGGLGGDSPPLSGEAANRSLGTNTDFFTEPPASRDGPDRLPVPPFQAQLRLDLALLDQSPQLAMWERLEVSERLLHAIADEIDPEGSGGRHNGGIRRGARCCKCPRTKEDDAELLLSSSDTFSLLGTVKCAGWVCPVCGSNRARSGCGQLGLAIQRQLEPPALDPGIKSRRRAGEPREMDAAVQEEYARRVEAWRWRDAWLLTIAPPHYPEETLVDYVDRLYTVCELLKKTRGWKRFSERYGITAEVRGLDGTHGGVNGSHGHFHIVLFVDNAAIDSAHLPLPKFRTTGFRTDAAGNIVEVDQVEITKEEIADHFSPLPAEPLRFQSPKLRRKWLREVVAGLVPAFEASWRKAGGEIRDVASFRRRALDLQGAEHASSYLYKWGLADEVGASGAKSRSHLRLLDAHAAGVPNAGAVYVAWRDAVHGRAWITGLKKVVEHFHITDEDVDEYLAKLREARDEAALERGEELKPEVRPLRLKVRRHLFATAARIGWPAVHAVVREANARGDADPQLALDMFLWQQQLSRPRGGPEPPAPS